MCPKIQKGNMPGGILTGDGPGAPNDVSWLHCRELGRIWTEGRSGLGLMVTFHLSPRPDLNDKRLFEKLDPAEIEGVSFLQSQRKPLHG